MGRPGKAETMDERAHFLDAPSGPKPENHLALLAWRNLDDHLHGSSRVESCAHPAREARTLEGCRPPEGPVASQEFEAVARHGPRRILDVDERDPVGEITVVAIARQKRAGFLVNLGLHVK